MVKKTVQVTLSVPDHESRLLGVPQIEDVLRRYLSGTAYFIESVGALRPPGTNKIDAITDLSSLTGLRLSDAKLLVEVAEHRGEIRWDESIVIYYDHSAPDGAKYVVVDEES